MELYWQIIFDVLFRNVRSLFKKIWEIIFERFLYFIMLCLVEAKDNIPVLTMKFAWQIRELVWFTFISTEERRHFICVCIACIRWFTSGEQYFHFFLVYSKPQKFGFSRIRIVPLTHGVLSIVLQTVLICPKKLEIF